MESSHVIPALIRKCIEARESGQQRILGWGSGAASREFLYVKDATEAIVMAAESYNKPEPVNLGSGEEIRIRELAGLIRELCGFQGAIESDSTKPDGQPRRCLDVRRAHTEFGFRASTVLRTGLRETIEWYEGVRRVNGISVGGAVIFDQSDSGHPLSLFYHFELIQSGR